MDALTKVFCISELVKMIADYSEQRDAEALYAAIFYNRNGSMWVPTYNKEMNICMCGNQGTCKCFWGEYDVRTGRVWHDEECDSCGSLSYSTYTLVPSRAYTVILTPKAYYLEDLGFRVSRSWAPKSYSLCEDCVSKVVNRPAHDKIETLTSPVQKSRIMAFDITNGRLKSICSGSALPFKRFSNHAISYVGGTDNGRDRPNVELRAIRNDESEPNLCKGEWFGRCKCGKYHQGFGMGVLFAFTLYDDYDHAVTADPAFIYPTNFTQAVHWHAFMRINLIEHGYSPSLAQESVPLKIHRSVSRPGALFSKVPIINISYLRRDLRSRDYQLDHYRDVFHGPPDYSVTNPVLMRPMWDLAFRFRSESILEVVVKSDDVPYLTSTSMDHWVTWYHNLVRRIPKAMASPTLCLFDHMKGRESYRIFLSMEDGDTSLSMVRSPECHSTVYLDTKRVTIIPNIELPQAN